MDITTHPFLNIIWSFFVIFLWISWFALLIGILRDIFHRHMSGVAKALWIVVLIFVPFFGAFVYLIANGATMGRSDASSGVAASAPPATGGAAGEIERAASLRDAGVITEAEFQALKVRALAA